MKVLNQVCTNDIDQPPGRLIYTQWLNNRGGIEADLTVTRLDEHSFLIVTAAETEARDFSWLQKHIPGDAHCVVTIVWRKAPVANAVPIMTVQSRVTRFPHSD